MRLLLASFIILHVADDHVTGAPASRDHTFLEMKNDIRPQRFLRSYDNDERMLPSPFLGKTPEEIFNAVRVGTEEQTESERVHNILQTMQHENMEQALAALEEEDTSFISSFIGAWGIDAVATAFAKAKHSDNPDIAKKGKKLSENLMRLWDSEGYMLDKIWDLLKPNLEDKKHIVDFFTGGRVELLDDYIKFKSGGESNDDVFFVTLVQDFDSYADLAHFISLSRKVDETVKPLEKRFVKYFVDSGLHSDMFFKMLQLPKHQYEMFDQPEFNMVGEFLVLEGIPKNEIPLNFVKVISNGLGGDGNLAIMLAKGVQSSRFKGISERCLELLFQHLKENQNVGPDDISIIFEDVKNLASNDRAYAREVKQKYQKWYAEHT